MLDNLVRMLLNVDERYREADIVHRILNYIHTLCHENKTFRRRPVAKQKGMVFDGNSCHNTGKIDRQ